MGDISQALPPSASPLHYIRRVSYEKGWQILKPITSIYEKIVVPAAFRGRPGSLTENESFWWIMFCAVPWTCVFFALSGFVVHSGVFIQVTVNILTAVYIMCHLIAHVSVLYRYRDAPFRLIGAKARLMIEVIPMITAAALHHLLEFNDGYLLLLVGCTSCFYAFAHIMHAAYDIGGIDVLVGLGMQVFMYMLKGELLVQALGFSICLGLCLCRYMTYCAPEVPAHRKKELELLPY